MTTCTPDNRQLDVLPPETADAFRALTVLTSNRGFEEWGHVLGDEVLTAALTDRPISITRANLRPLC